MSDVLVVVVDDDDDLADKNLEQKNHHLILDAVVLPCGMEEED